MSYYLSTYNPLISTKLGRVAIKKYCIHPFVDGSCRREPDFESTYPSISSLCHGRNFAPRLKENDIVIFITKKGSYLNIKSHWRLCAILNVQIVFENHQKASEWYKTKNEKIPSNCMIQGNIPNDLDRTIGARKHESLEKWDLGYKIRSRKWPKFVVTNTIYKELDNPPIITEEDMMSIFSRIPATRNPPQIKISEYEKLLKMTN